MRWLPRVFALAVTALALALAPAQPPWQGIWPGDAWTSATPASQGVNPAPFEALDAAIKAGTYGHIDRLLVVSRGRLVINYRYARDYREISRGKRSYIGCGEGCADPSAMHQFNYFHPDWHPYYQGRQVHSMQSVTKSIAATLVGIAIGRGEVDAPSEPFLPWFEDRDLSKVDRRLHRATLADLLTMRSGIEWHEGDRPLGPTNTTVQLELSDNWIDFTLSQPMDADPGTKWVYNSGGSHLMSGIIRAATGRFIDAYAREHLFTPIGIRDFHWKKDPQGYPDTEGGLYLTAEDLVRIGYLYLRDGRWNGQRVLPEGWVREATTRHVQGLAGGWDYGYQWWLTNRNGVDVWAGRGFGGQLLFVVPSRDLVGVMTAWNVFGDRVTGIQGPFLDAMTTASAPSGGRPTP